MFIVFCTLFVYLHVRATEKYKNRNSDDTRQIYNFYFFTMIVLRNKKKIHFTDTVFSLRYKMHGCERFCYLSFYRTGNMTARERYYVLSSLLSVDTPWVISLPSTFAHGLRSPVPSRSYKRVTPRCL